MTQPSTPPPPPGWYPDPYGGRSQRYWDGRAWLGQTVAPEPRKSSPAKALLVVGAILFVVLGGCVALVAVAGSGNNRKSAAQSGGPTASARDLDPTQYQAISPRDYALVVKDPDAAKGRKLVVYGVVTQFDAATGTSEFRASTGAEKAERRYDYDVNTMIHAPDPVILKNVVEGDFVSMHVEVAGSYSYDTQIGGHTIVPKLNVYIIAVTGSAK